MTAPAVEPFRLRLLYRPPLNLDALIGFLAARATPGVELVTASGYQRTIALGVKTGTIAVTRATGRSALALDVRFPGSRARAVIVARVQRMFDLDADPRVIAKHLGDDSWLGPVLKRHPGLRTPGAWDGFELSVRAILGQQVSVAAATTIAGRLARRFGTALDTGPGLDRTFPTPAQLAAAPIEEAGVIRSRAEAIRGLARAVLAGRIGLAPSANPDVVTRALQALPGIGPWTAHYIAMRALDEPDAFLAGDLILRQMAGGCTARARELERHAERWRPWRAYAVMLLWQAAKDAQKGMDEIGRISPISKHARGDRGRTGRGQEHSGSAARRPVSQRIVRRG